MSFHLKQFSFSANIINVLLILDFRTYPFNLKQENFQALEWKYRNKGTNIYWLSENSFRFVIKEESSGKVCSQPGKQMTKDHLQASSLTSYNQMSAEKKEAQYTDLNREQLNSPKSQNRPEIYQEKIHEEKRKHFWGKMQLWLILRSRSRIPSV